MSEGRVIELGSVSGRHILKDMKELVAWFGSHWNKKITKAGFLEDENVAGFDFKWGQETFSQWDLTALTNALNRKGYALESWSLSYGWLRIWITPLHLIVEGAEEPDDEP